MKKGYNNFSGTLSIGINAKDLRVDINNKSALN